MRRKLYGTSILILVVLMTRQRAACWVCKQPEVTIAPPADEKAPQAAPPRHDSGIHMLGAIGRAAGKANLTLLSQKETDSYFGPVARDRFFGLYRTIAHQRQHYTKDQTKHFVNLRQQLLAHSKALRRHRRRRQKAATNGEEAGGAEEESSWGGGGSEEDETDGDDEATVLTNSEEDDTAAVSSSSGDALLDEPWDVSGTVFR